MNEPIALLYAASPLAQYKVGSAQFTGVGLELSGWLVYPILNAWGVVVHQIKVAPTDGPRGDFPLGVWDCCGSSSEVFFLVLFAKSLSIALGRLGSAEDDPRILIHAPSALVP